MFNENPAATPALNLNDYWRIVVRRRWWILTSVFVCWLGAWTASWIMPAVYRSETLIVAEQPKVPQDIVATAPQIDLEAQLDAMKQQVLSRSRLQHIIEQFKLYDAVAKRLGAEGAVDQMRKDIKIEPVESPNKPHGEFTAFRISYYAPNAHLAQLVNTQITSLFINENIEEQSQKS
ncbi:MAG: Wzz/FepE/Etk N-terminal domain-containing protein, partial [Terriglobales bacterium]